MELSLVKDIVILFTLAIVVLLICYRLHLPSIVGFLFTGIASGPHGLGLIHGMVEVETLAEMGIMLLLFTIGLEFSLKRLLQIKRYVFVGGFVQLVLTTFIGFCVAQILNRPLGESLFVGFLLTMSSTAIVSKALEASDEADSPQGCVDMGILIFQDLIAVPLILIVPLLGSSQSDFEWAFLGRLFGGFAIILAVSAAAIKVIPFLLYRIAQKRSRELFLLSVLTICFSVAWLASSLGLSLAIGAFLAGLIISDTEYNHEVISNILPLQDIFSSLFFVSIGMLLDLQFFLQQPFFILLTAAGVMFMKACVVLATTYILKLPLRIMILSSLALCQVGEFAFVLAKTGMDVGIGTEYLNQLFLAVAIITMAVTPTLIQFSHEITHLCLRLPIPEKWKLGLRKAEEKVKHSDHIVIIGFGVAGRNMARASKDANVPYTIIEFNPITVRTEKAKGEPIHFGDASHMAVLHHVHIESAKAVAIMINDGKAAKRIVSLIHQINPKAYLIVRTRYSLEVPLMYALGAHEVISDEAGTSIEMFVRVLQKYEVPQERIDGLVNNLRAERFQPSHS